MENRFKTMRKSATIYALLLGLVSVVFMIGTIIGVNYNFNLKHFEILPKYSNKIVYMNVIESGRPYHDRKSGYIHDLLIKDENKQPIVVAFATKDKNLSKQLENASTSKPVRVVASLWRFKDEATTNKFIQKYPANVLVSRYPLKEATFINRAMPLVISAIVSIVLLVAFILHLRKFKRIQTLEEMYPQLKDAIATYTFHPKVEVVLNYLVVTTKESKVVNLSEVQFVNVDYIYNRRTPTTVRLKLQKYDDTVEFVQLPNLPKKDFDALSQYFASQGKLV